jgi:hypothetical protein
VVCPESADGAAKPLLCAESALQPENPASHAQFDSINTSESSDALISATGAQGPRVDWPDVGRDLKLNAEGARHVIP